MTCFLLPVVAALTAVAPPQAEVRNVRILSPRLAVSKAKGSSDAQVVGQVRVDMSFVRPTVRQPVLRIDCLCEVDGALVVHTAFLGRPRTNEGLSRSALADAFRRAGVDVPFAEREIWYQDPARFTPLLPEVDKTKFVAAIYGSSDTGRGFFRLGRTESMPKVLLYRLELWQNGVCVESYDSSRSGLGTYGIPEDWNVRGKYPQKFKYADIR